MATVQTMDYVNVNQAAERLGCTPGRVRQLIAEGALPGEKFTEKAWAIPRKALERYARQPQVKRRPRVAEKSRKSQ